MPQRFQLNRNLVERGTDHMQVAPVKLINEFLTAETFTFFPSEPNLKQAIRYQIRKQRPP